jgi:hypothetical protein
MLVNGADTEANSKNEPRARRQRPDSARCFTPLNDLIHSTPTEVQINGLKSTAALRKPLSYQVLERQVDA